MTSSSRGRAASSKRVKMATAPRDASKNGASTDDERRPQTVDGGDSDALSSPKATPPPPKPSLTGDWHNFALLLALYTLQGIPIGLASSVPLFLQSRGASFSDQATFGLSSWPYSLKLLWAPVVDAVYTRRFGLGHRKSWIVPIQLAAGVIMIALGSRLDDVFGGAPEGSTSTTDGAEPPFIDIAGLTSAFFLLYLLVATQDIAVDGWALTLLRPENVGYASTANTVGQSAGVMMAYGLLMALDSADFCNRWVRSPLGLSSSPTGLVTMASFMQYWGAFFMVSTLALWALKREEEEEGVSGAGSSAGGGDEDGHASASASGVASSVSGTAVGEGGGGGTLLAVEIAAPSTSTSSSSARAVSGDGASKAVPSRGRSARRLSVGSNSSSRGSSAGGTSGGSSSSSSTSSNASGSVRRRTPRGSADRGTSDDDVHRSGKSAKGTTTRLKGDDAADVTSPHRPSSGSVATVEDSEVRGLLAPPPSTSSSSAGNGASTDGIATTAAAATSWSASSAWADVRAAYHSLGRVIRLPPVLSLVLVMATAKVGFTAVDSATSLVMQAHGLTKETIAFFDVLSTPLQLAFPLLISKLVAGPRPMTLFLRMYPLRIAAGLVYLAIIYGGGAGVLNGPGGPPPSALGLALIFLVSNAHSLVLTSMFLAQISFFTQVSDPGMGGSYMTLLNTVANLGNMWPRWFVLRAIDALTEKVCVPPSPAAASSGSNSSEVDAEALQGLACKSPADKAACSAAGGVCDTVRDGYLTMVLLSSVVAAVWWLMMRRRIKALEAAPRSAWLPAPE